MVGVEAVQPLQCFNGLSEKQLAQLCNIAEERRFQKGDYVQKEGTECDAMHVVKEGRVLVEMTLPGNHVIAIHTVTPGDLFGWSAIVPPHKVTAASRCLEDCVTIALPGPALLELFQQDVGIKAEVFEFLTHAVGRRLTETREQVSYLLG
ncbi:MAG: cyclic nucleotide-binding domain-containing protein [Candidatus Hinthialibacter antarcticus]|nr:cyclic nucleotide-binding domain-containing protein [Candidatus Hinthialibacter antarcticus]